MGSHAVEMVYSEERAFEGALVKDETYPFDSEAWVTTIDTHAERSKKETSPIYKEMKRERTMKSFENMGKLVGDAYRTVFDMGSALHRGLEKSALVDQPIVKGPLVRPKASVYHERLEELSKTELYTRAKKLGYQMNYHNTTRAKLITYIKSGGRNGSTDSTD